jgi:hypothetical protein
VSGPDDFWDLCWLGINNANRLEALAQRWLRYTEAAEQLTDAIWASYDRFCGDKASVIERLVDELGLEEHVLVTTHVNHQFKKDFGDRRIRGCNRWQAELSNKQAAEIDAICGATWRRVEQRCVSTSV